MRSTFTLRKVGLFVIAMLSLTLAGAQTIAWNFSDGTANASTTAANITVSSLLQGNNNGTTAFVTNSSVSSGYAGVSGTFNAGVAARTGALSTGAGGSAYVEFTITPAASYVATLTGISFGARSTSTGAQAYTLRSSLDNYAADIATGTIANNSSWSLKSNTGLSVSSGTGTAVTFRVYVYAGTGSASAGTANTRFDDISVSVTAAPPVISSNADLSALAMSGGSLSPSFSSATLNYSASVPNSTSATTLSFTKANANATVTASLNSGTFGSATGSFALNEGSNTIDVRVVAQDGVTQKDYILTITRAAAATPSLLVSGNTAFGSSCLNTPVTNTFTLNGSSLDGSPITIGALPGFSYSETSGGTYTSTLSFTYSGGAFSDKQVYVRFNPSAAQSYNGTIPIAGGGATSNTAVTAAGINSAATVSSGSANVTGTSATLSGSIASSGCSAVSSFGFEYSTVSGFAAGTGTVVTAATLNAGAFSKTVTGLAAATTYYYKAFATNAGGTAYGAEASFTTSSVVPVIMSAQPLLRYTEGFNDISNWSANFASGTGANRFSSVGVSATGPAIPSPTRTTTSTATFSSGTSGGVQKGTGAILLLSTGSTDNSSSSAIDFYMDFTGVNAGTLSFDWSAVPNSTGDRKGSLRVYGSTDGVNFTEITAADVLDVTNNVPATGTVNTVALPASFSNNPSARLRFYYHNGTGGSTGSRPKISIDNLTVTAVPSSPCATPSAAATALSFSTIAETSISGSFAAASPAANEYLVIMSTNPSLTNNPLDGQTYVVGDNVGDGTVIAKGAELNFTATDLTGATTYYFFVFSVNSVCTGGPKYLTTDVLTDDATTVAGLPACSAPAGQPSGFAATASINTVQGSFTATAADEYIVLQSTGSSFSGTLVNGTVYNAGQTIGNATVVQRSSATTFNASGLAPQTQYYYFIYSINSQGCVNGPVYNTVNPLAGIATTLPLPVCTTPTAQPSDLSFNSSNNSVTATFNAGGAGYNYLVVMSTSSTLSATPVDNTDYSAGTAFGGGTVVSNGTSTSFIATNLNNSTTYYFFVFSANKNCTGGTKYLVASPLSGSATTTNAPVNNYYFGNLHAHTDYSDGQKDHPGATPTDAYNYALGSMGMDFLGISEHNHFSTVNNPGNEIANYHSGTAQANAFNAAHSNFLALYGMEWGVISGGGHVLVYGDGLTELFGWESNVNGNVGANYDIYVPKSTYLGVEGLFARVNDYVAKNAFASLAHPNSADYNNLSNIAYDASADAAISGVAVESGPATSTNTTYSNPSTMSYLWYYNKLLAKGYHLGPMIDHDNHNTTFGRHTPARTAVIAPALTQSAIMKAVRDMHFYATEDMDAKVDFTINTRIMGSIFEDRNAPSIAVNLTDATNATTGALIRVMYGQPGSGIDPVVIDSVFGSSLSYVDNALANHATGYYYIDITNNGKRIVTSPIWYTRTCASASDTTATVCGSFNWYGTEYTSSATATKVFTTAGGCDSTVTLHLTISNPPSSVTLSAVGAPSGCPGTGVALHATPVDGGNGSIVSYEWVKDGSVVATTTSATYTATTSGSYTVNAYNAGHCSAGSNPVTITVTDATAPVPTVATLPTLTGSCSVTVSTTPTATDNCAGLVIASTNDPLTYTTQGTYTIHWTYSDGNGNTTAQEQTVIVADTEQPAITAPASISVVNDAGQCGATINDLGTPVTSDNCAVATVSNDHPSTYFPVGTTIVTWKVTDASGNVTDTATQQVTVIDNELPHISVSNITVNNTPGSCSANITLPAPVASDNCGVASVTADHTSGIFPVGTTTITWTVTDNNGWTQTATQTVTVTDNEAPVVTAPGEVSVTNDAGQCGAIVAIGSPETSDNCGIASITNDHPSNYFPVGTTIVKWIVTDIHGNVTDTATQKVTVIDNEPPAITVSPATFAADAGCGANVVLLAPPVSDNCGVYSVTNDHPSVYFPVGNTTVTWTATDSHGWSTTATQLITVKDQQAPVVTTQNITIYLDASGVANIAPSQVNNGSTDNCSIVTMSLDKTSFHCSELGNNTVTLTITDASGNSASATAVVTVKDNTAPVLTAQNATIYLNASGTATVAAAQLVASAADNCGVMSYSVSKASFNCGNLGNNTVTVTATDASGNTATATATVIVKDNIAPVLTTQPVTVYLNASGTATVTAAQLLANGTDNCGTPVYAVSQTIFNCSQLGANTVTVTATDASGNATMSNVVVTVKDNIVPIVTTQPVTLYLNASGTATLAAAQVVSGGSDNCGVVSYSVNKTSFSCSNLGANTVTVTVADASGNTASATAVVTVKDNTVPVITAVPAQTFCIASGTYTIPALTATDNCSTVITSYAITGATMRSGTGNNASGAFNPGVSTITWTVKDASGNTASSSTTVTVSALPAATITVSSPDAFCNKLTLTANTTATGATYKWTSGAATIATTPSLSLGQSNGDGVYQVTVSLNGCTSAPATYNYQKQTLLSSYTLLAFEKIDLGSNNTVASGSVGVTGAKGEVELGSFSSIASAGSFVKAKTIDKNGLFINISNPIYAPATGIALPAMQLNTANANSLPNKDVAQNSISTVNGNYKNLTLKKGSRTTLTGTVFGSIRVEQGAQVTFTAPSISIDKLEVVKGPRNGYSYVRFAGDAKVMVSTSVSIGSQVFVNPDNNNVTFYMGDKKSDDERFVVSGGDTKVNANVYMPKGKLKVTGGYSYGIYGLLGLGDCDRDDDDDRYFGLGSSYVNMTGTFIAENIVGNGKNVIWNGFDCGAAPVPVINTTPAVITQSAGEKTGSVTSEETLKVTVLPNPSTSYFTLKIESKYETPVNIRVMDSRGRVIDSRSKVGSNSSVQLGRDYAGGTYFAELIQGTQRKVVQLVKVRG